MRKDKAKRDKEAIKRGSIASFGNNPWEKDLPKFYRMQDQERAEEEERQRAHGQPAYGQPASGQPASGQPAPGQPAPGQPAHGQRQLEQQDHIGRAY